MIEASIVGGAIILALISLVFHDVEFNSKKSLWYRIILTWWRWITMSCRYCGCHRTRAEITPDRERPKWRIFCTSCGRRRTRFDGFIDR